MSTLKADLCIIGAGSGGLSVAAGAAQLGRKVILLEKGEMGGDCLNYGCVPSKALLAAAKHAASARKAAQFGVNLPEPDIDFPAVMDHVRSVIASIEPHDSQERFEGLGVTVIREAGVFSSADVIQAGPHKIKAKHIIIATGSRPFIPPIEGLSETPFLTNETIFENREQPAHLIIIGGGPIGVEMAQAHRRLGSAVTIIEGGKLLSRDDRQAVQVVRDALVTEGITIKQGAHAEKVSRQNAGVTVTLKDGEEITGTHLLIATGRTPNVEGLELENAGIEYDRRGIKTDNRLRTSAKRIYAIGDVASGPQFTHMAGDHASTIIRNVLFKAPSKRNDAITPHVTYTDPELASVGLTQEAARAVHGDAIKTARFSYADNDRARAEKRTEGFITIVTKKNGEILGATIVGLNAGELIHPWAVALANKRKVSDFTAYIAPYPTLGELTKRAAGAWYTPTLFSNRTRMLVRLLGAFD